MPPLVESGIPGVRIGEPQRFDGRVAFAEVAQARAAQRRRSDPRRKAALVEATRFYYEVLDGQRPRWQLEEAMTTSDFPLVFGDILQRELLGGYANVPASWPAYVRRRTLPDTTRQARRLAYDGLDSHMTSTAKVPNQTVATEDNVLAETGYLVGPLAVYQREVAINWATLLADDLGAFRDIPGKLALAARRTEEFLVAGLLCTSAGPDSTFFAAGNRNLITPTYGAVGTNPVLGVPGLVDARKVLAQQTNATTGERITVDGAALVIPSELDVIAAAAFNATEIRTNDSALAGQLTGLSNSSGKEVQLIMNNWITSGLKAVVNQYLSTINTTNGTTAWYVVADPAKNRPAFELDFLQGEEQPILLREVPNAVRVGGGSADMFGNFDTGEIRFKVMHILSAHKLDPKGAIASSGAGS